MEPEQVPPAPRRPRTEARDLERYAALFAARTRQMRSSAMRNMMSIATRPEVISLAGGLPDTSTFPIELFEEITSGIAADGLAGALQYGPTEGLDGLREAIPEVMAREGTGAEPEDVTVTTGGQQALDLVTRALVDPGDVLICDAPTYPGALPTFAAYQADVIQVERLLAARGHGHVLGFGTGPLPRHHLGDRLPEAVE
ncbi:MAG: aminotransferase class I/II-fold pyridoxal phosphate-dependent enzyme, partial [Solirubrobacterales bacterium]